MSTKLRLDGWLTIPSNLQISFDLAGGTPAITVTLVPGDSNYFQAVLAHINSHLTGTNVLMSVDSDTGKVKIQAGTSETYAVAMDAALQTIFGFGAASFNFTTSVTASNYPTHCISLDWRAITDARRYVCEKNTFETDTNIVTQHFTTKQFRKINFRFGGWQRDSGQQYQMVENFFVNVVLPGLKFKYWPDFGTDTAAYGVGHLFGYDIGISQGADFAPAQLGNSNSLWTIELDFLILGA